MYPTIGGIVHVYSRDWSGPRPAIIVGVVNATTVTLNVFIDGVNEPEVLAKHRDRTGGNTYDRVVYDGNPCPRCTDAEPIVWQWPTATASAEPATGQDAETDTTTTTDPTDTPAADQAES